MCFMRRNGPIPPPDTAIIYNEVTEFAENYRTFATRRIGLFEVVFDSHEDAAETQVPSTLSDNTQSTQHNTLGSQATCLQ